ncbi:MAG: TolB family protein [Chitinophagaceae bacterium]
MQRLFLLFIFISFVVVLSGQANTEDSIYVTRISSLKWMPDGKAILLGIVKYHKTNHQAPFFSKVLLYNIQSRELKFLFDDGSNLTVSPDGKTIAFLKRSETKGTAIYFYNIYSRQTAVLEPDTMGKYGLAWSPDGKNLAYNISKKGEGKASTVDICVLNLAAKKVKQITSNTTKKSYNPEWSPDGEHIAYYLEKGDGHDQVWLTDLQGSFHKNLTNDTSTHNYYPSWFDNKTIIYTQSPSLLMMMNSDGNNKQKIEGINSTPVQYNAKAGQLAYIKSEEENKLILFDWKKKTTAEVLDGTKLMGQF